MKAKLVVVGGDAKTAEVNLRLPTIIGRGREATLTLPHPLVSRRHCEIFEADGGLFVRDLGSLNGTFVGNERVTEAALPPGELLTIGTVTFRAVYESNGFAPPSGGAAAGGDTLLAAETNTARTPERAAAGVPDFTAMDGNSEDGSDDEDEEFVVEISAEEAELEDELAEELDEDLADELAEFAEPILDDETEEPGPDATALRPLDDSTLPVPTPEEQKPAPPLDDPGPTPPSNDDEDDDLQSFFKALSD